MERVAHIAIERESLPRCARWLTFSVMNHIRVRRIREEGSPLSTIDAPHYPFPLYKILFYFIFLLRDTILEIAFEGRGINTYSFFRLNEKYFFMLQLRCVIRRKKRIIFRLIETRTLFHVTCVYVFLLYSAPR